MITLRHINNIAALSLCVLLMPACAEDLGLDGDDAANEDSGLIEHEDQGEGVTRTQVDGTDEADHVYLDLDLDMGTETSLDDPGWDLGFRRYDVIVDGGIHGDAGVEVAVLDGEAFDSLLAVPSDVQWITDEADGDDEDMDPDTAFVDWYDYDFMTHVLTPKDRVYLVRSSEGAVFKLQFVDYYSSAGTSGFVSFDWAALN
ncbi:HmuY family protein [Enhygromyxa salina]|uniref:Lipoprotein n=1 Tax=Enhygromyxa salina TaxID=215803 RepID=A0A2S9XQ14_9BACT|nr:HmuY family protein [Enhygromyxa salina]PRP94840.1 hypothetical protein ENSA7_76630 [Enhygromyxa salina]